MAKDKRPIKYKSFSVRMTESFYDEFHKASSDLEIDASKLMRFAIREALDKLNNSENYRDYVKRFGVV